MHTNFVRIRSLGCKLLKVQFAKFVKFVVSIHKAYCLWHRVIPAAAPRVARQDALEGEPAALEKAIFPDGLDAVVGAGRHITATLAQPRRQRHLIESDQEYQELSGNVCDAPHAS